MCQGARRRLKPCCTASFSCRKRSSAPAPLLDDPQRDMTATANEKISALAAKVEARLAGLVQRVPALPDELCYEVQPASLKQVCLALRDSPELRFEILVDLAGIDYLDYGTTEWKTLSATASGFSRGVSPTPRRPHDGARFAVAYNLLSITNNQRLRIRARCEDAEDPLIDSVVDIWPGANWFERE